MFPRYALPEANPFPAPVPIGDFGKQLNFTDAAADYRYGLLGVSQYLNFLGANVIIAGFFVLLAITLVHRWVHMFTSWCRQITTMGRRDDQVYWVYNHSKVWAVIKKRLIYAPLFKTQHNKEVQLTKSIALGALPGRFHTLLLFMYSAANIAFDLILDWNNPNPYSVLAMLRGRSGTLAVLNLIPTVLFALRNNPLIHITGVSYDTFNFMHRWCARWTVIQATVHTVVWAVNSLATGGNMQVYVELKTSASFFWGMIGTVAFGAVFLLAFGPIRHRFYEFFLNSHRALVLLGIIGVYVHLEAAGLPEVPYIWLVLAFWGGEWTWRFARIFYHNLSRQRGWTRVTVEALPAEACRVTFELRRHWHWEPGCHVHAYLPRYALWSSHPFSVAWVENVPLHAALENGDVEKTAGARGDAHKSGLSEDNVFARRNTTLNTVAGNGIPGKGNIDTTVPKDTVSNVSLVMRARTGLTRQLYNAASKSPTGSITTWGALEGPYGGHDTMASYGTVLLFAGGVGITHCVGYCHHLILAHQAGTAATRKVLLVWSVPNTEALEWVRVWMDKILRMEGRRDILRIQLFVTKPRHRGEVVSNTGSVQMFPGRCNPSTIIQKEMQDRVGTVGVTVCGPGAFSDSVRAAVREVVEEGAVDFIEEAFSY